MFPYMETSWQKPPESLISSVLIIEKKRADFGKSLFKSLHPTLLSVSSPSTGAYKLYVYATSCFFPYPCQKSLVKLISDLWSWLNIRYMFQTRIYSFFFEEMSRLFENIGHHTLFEESQTLGKIGFRVSGHSDTRSQIPIHWKLTSLGDDRKAEITLLPVGFFCASETCLQKQAHRQVFIISSSNSR